jgi:hypothetical protein
LRLKNETRVIVMAADLASMKRCAARGTTGFRR